jgi:hypothetical protein
MAPLAHNAYLLLTREHHPPTVDCYRDRLALQLRDEEASMLRIFAIGLIATSVAACDATSTVTEGFKQARSVESDLETATGVKPNVGFNWQNGQLVTVTVVFPAIPETKPLREIADEVRTAVGKEFKQVPNNVVLAFSLGKLTPGTQTNAPAMSRWASMAR